MYESPLPRSVGKRCFVPMANEPCPDKRVESIPYSGHLLRSRLPPRLGLLDTQELLSVPKCIFDGPSAGKSLDEQRRIETQVCGEEKVVLFLSLGIPGDDQPDVFSRQNRVPNNMADMNQSRSNLPSLVGFHASPGRRGLGYLRRRWKAFPALPMTSSLAGLRLWWQPINGRIVSNTAHDFDTTGKVAGQRGVETVSDQENRPIREPFCQIEQHFSHEVKYRFSCGFGRPLSVQSHVDGQCEGLPTPGRVEKKAQQNDLKTPDIHDSLGGRSNGIPAAFCTINLATGFLWTESSPNTHKMLGWPKSPTTRVARARKKRERDH
jgi:hypothetical protein